MKKNDKVKEEEISFTLKFKKSAARDLAKLGNPGAKRVLEAIRTKLLMNPHEQGKMLKGSLRDLRSFRVGDYRVLYTFSDEELWVLVVRIGHRRDIYD